MTTILGSYIPASRRVLAVGDSFFARAHLGANRNMVMSEMNMLRYATRQAFDFDFALNKGVNGNNLGQIAARLPGILEAEAAPTVVVPMTFNDRGSANRSMSDTMSDLNTIYRECMLRERFLVLLGPSAAGDSTGGMFFSPQQEKLNVAVRREALDIYGGLPGVEFIDMFPGYADPYSANCRALDGMPGPDKLHPSPRGAYQRMLRMLPFFQSRWRQRLYTAFSNTEGRTSDHPKGARNPNPALNSNGGTLGTNGSGDIASGWIGGQADTNITRTYSKIVVADGVNVGRPAQRVVLGTKAAPDNLSSANDQVSLMIQNLTGQTVGDQVRLVIEIDRMFGLKNIQAISAIINPNGPSFDGGVADWHYIDGTNANRAGNTNPIGNMPPEVMHGVLMTPPFTLTDATPRIGLVARTLSGLAVEGTIDILSIGLMGA